MQRNSVPGISPSEWRWVIIFSGLMVAITLLPYAWAFASDSPADSWQFMGMLPNPRDGATYLAKINEGMNGHWLFYLPYTPEAHSGAAINVFYLFLGHIAQLTGLSSLLIYHIARLATGFVMYVSIYYLGSVIWPRLRPRRLFFSMLAVGSGLGWLYLVVFGRGSVLDSAVLPSDLAIPESIPFYAAFVNPHFPLAIALIALIASMFVVVFRPGFNEQPSASNGGITVILLTIALAIVQPQGLFPITAALGAYLVLLALRVRRIPFLELNWVALAVLPALPFAIYYLAVARDNPAMRVWSEQNVTISPPPDKYILGFGLVLIIALPGLWRGFRYFERDGDRFMLLWLVVNTVLLYLPRSLSPYEPLSIQRRFSIGLIIPIAYFAVRALEDYWFNRIRPPWRDAALVAVFVFIVPSNILAISIPIYGVVKPDAGIENFQLLHAGHGEAIQWLKANGRTNDVVLAPPGPSLWIPAYTDLRVVYGHPYETLNATQKFKEVTAWFDGEDCNTAIEKYHVRYIISDYIQPGRDGTVEPPASGCFKNLNSPVASFHNVFIYALY